MCQPNVRYGLQKFVSTFTPCASGHSSRHGGRPCGSGDPPCFAHTSMWTFRTAQLVDPFENEQKNRLGENGTACIRLTCGQRNEHHASTYLASLILSSSLHISSVEGMRSRIFFVIEKQRPRASAGRNSEPTASSRENMYSLRKEI